MFLSHGSDSIVFTEIILHYVSAPDCPLSTASDADAAASSGACLEASPAVQSSAALQDSNGLYHETNVNVVHEKEMTKLVCL